MEFFSRYLIKDSVSNFGEISEYFQIFWITASKSVCNITALENFSFVKRNENLYNMM